jgi:hypothetical protein
MPGGPPHARGSASDDQRAEPRDDGRDADHVSRTPWSITAASGTRPVPYPTVLHGVDTGKRKPSDAPMVAAMTGSVGSMPAERANAITTGTTLFADAVLLVVSDSTVASSVDVAIRPKEVRTPAHAAVNSVLTARIAHASTGRKTTKEDSRCVCSLGSWV